MNRSTTYTRVFSQSSAGELVSGKGLGGSPLSHTQLLDEFRVHSNKANRVPTALVSVSTRLIDTVRRAFEKHYHDGESPAEIWVAFIQVPTTAHENTAQIHHAQDLANAWGFPKPKLFHYECLFEWAIPKEYLRHRVSLKTLMDRGLDWGRYLVRDQLGSERRCLSTAELRRSLASDLRQNNLWNNPWEIGICLASFARYFGARAPVDWVSLQYFHDCVPAELLENDVVRLNHANGKSEVVDVRFFSELDSGIETVLCDWWFTDFDFLQACEDFEEWRSVKKDGMVWDKIEFCETWNINSQDGGDGVRCEKERLAYEKAWGDLLTKHEGIMTAIEEEAVKLGL